MLNAVLLILVGTTAVVSAICVDQVNPSTGVSDCASMSSYCNNALYYTLMTAQCPLTCGRCSISTTTATTTSSSTTCYDRVNPSTGVSDCPSRAYLCNNSVYYSLMTTQCPRTCGRCSSTATTTTYTSSSCVDQVNPSTGVSDCASRAAYCNNSVYYTLMTAQCPRTCGRCSSTSSVISTSCYDRVNPSTGVSDCAARVSLCNNSLYYTLMTAQCPLTCGRCSG